MKRCIAGLFVALVVSLSISLFDAGPASACSCMRFTDAEAFARADAVFVGRVVGYKAPARRISSVDPALWTFAVSQVYKGEVTRTQPIVSEVSGASCGLEIPRTGEFLVFASTRRSGPSPTPAPGQYYAGLCMGTRALSDGALQPGLATAHAPLQVAGAVPHAPARAEAGGSPGDSHVTRIVGVTVVASVGLGLALLVLRRRRLRDAPP